jgi:hypothetical protein
MKTLRVALTVAALVAAENDASTQILPDRPFVLNSTYWSAPLVGGPSIDDQAAIATDAAGNIYVAVGDLDVWISKFDPAGRLLSLAVYGGSATDAVNAIAVDPFGNVVIVGRTISTDLPLVNPIQSTFLGAGCGEFGGTCWDGFVAKINPANSQVLFASYLSTNGDDSANDVAVDRHSNIYVAGTANGGFANTTPLRPAQGPDAFVGKIPSSGRRFTYLTHLGGFFEDSGNGIAIDAAGNAYVTGTAGSDNFPTLNPIRAARENFGNDGFVTKLDPAGAIVYSTYLGGNGEDHGEDVAVDAAGHAYVVGSTGSSNFHLANPSQLFLRGFNDAFVAKLAPSGSSLVFSTYLGGSERERLPIDFSRAILKVALDADGNSYVTGITRSEDFPARFPVQPFGGGVCLDIPAFVLRACPDAYLSKFDRDGRLTFSTTIGGSREDRGRGVALGPNGIAYVVGVTGSPDFPLRSPRQAALIGPSDAFITTIATAPLGCQLPAPAQVTPAGGIFGQPTFSWQPVAGAEQYAVTAVKTGDTVMMGTPPVLTLGTTTATSLTPSTPLPDGDYTWYVTAWNRVCGWGAQSRGLSFTLPGHCPTPAAVPVSPIGGAAAANPTRFDWTLPGPSIAAFSAVVILQADGRVVKVLPSSGTTVTNPDTQSRGTHTWYVVTFNSTCGFAVSAPATYQNTGGTQ